MRLTKLPITKYLEKLSSDYDSYSLSSTDEDRIEPLEEVIKIHQLNFKYWITITPYKFVPNNEQGREIIHKENQFLRRHLRKFFKYDLKIWFFTEEYKDSSSKHIGGLHRHILLEDLPNGYWDKLTLPRGVDRFLLQRFPDIYFDLQYGNIPTYKQKEQLLNSVCRLCNQVGNGNKCLVIKPVHNLHKLIGYSTKQIGENNQNNWNNSAQIIDFENSDFLHEINIKTNERQQFINRSKAVFARTDL